MERSVKIPHNLEISPLQIKTDSAVGSGDRVILYLYTAGGEYVGIVQVSLNSSRYLLRSCSTSWTALPSTLPSEINKVWVITKLPGPRITLECNGVKVVDITLSDDTCNESGWSTYWTRGQVKQIEFDSSDTASDEYRAASPGN